MFSMVILTVEATVSNNANRCLLSSFKRGQEIVVLSIVMKLAIKLLYYLL